MEMLHCYSKQSSHLIFEQMTHSPRISDQRGLVINCAEMTRIVLKRRKPIQFV